MTGKVAVVTGASRGIGRAIAVDLARSGADVALFGRDTDALGETKAACEAAREGAKVTMHLADVASESETSEAIDAVVKEFGRIDVAVANAGQAKDGLILPFKGEDLDRLIDVNLKSAFYLSAAVAKPMMKQRGGAIVFVSSIVGLAGNPGQSAYAATKAGLLGLAKSLAKELGSRNIRVNSVAPGWVDTGMNDGVFSDKTYEGKVVEGIPLRRLASPDDIALSIVFLASDWARHITGEILNVNGGAVLCG